MVGFISTFPVKKSGLGLQNTETSEKYKYNSLIRASFNLIGEVKGERYFKLMITSGLLKGVFGTLKMIGMSRVMQNSRK